MQPDCLPPGLPTHSFLQTLSWRWGLRFKHCWYIGAVLRFNVQICSSFCWNIHLKWQRCSCDDTYIYIYMYLPWSTHIYFRTTEQSQCILPLCLLGLGLSFGGSNSVLLVIHTPYSPVQKLVIFNLCPPICSFLAELVLNLHDLWPCILLPRLSSFLSCPCFKIPYTSNLLFSVVKRHLHAFSIILW